MKLIAYLLILIILLIMSSCGVSAQYENYNLTSMADLTLTETNHPHGWEKANCFYCHVKQNLHQKDTLGIGTSLIETAKDSVNEDGINSCYNCHGNNGVN